MATEATVTVPSDEFPLGSVFDRLPDVTVELERMIPARDVVVPYCWVRGTMAADIDGAFTDHPGVVAIEHVDSVDDQHLLRIEWDRGYDGVLQALTETGLALVRAVGTNRQWTFEIRGDDWSDIAAFQTRCREWEIPITLAKLHALTPIETGTEPTLTEPQRATLALAYDRGYFNSPRDVTMADLGAELGVSQQAVASRLRRGLDRLLEGVRPGLSPPNPD